jgi:hypothetical protein
MSMVVVCNKCRRSFKVSERFAGKSGPCPNCKATIQIPAKQEEVKVHAPAEFGAGGRTIDGKLALKPIARKHAKLEPVAVVIIVGSALVVLLIGFVGGRFGLFDNLLVRAGALLLISPPLCVAGYSVLREDELEPYRGLWLWVRAAACGVAFGLLWWVYGYVAGSILSGELWEFMFVVPAFLALGAFVPGVTFDLEYGNGFLHYAFYVLVTAILAWVAGLGWPWDWATAGMAVT